MNQIFEELADESSILVKKEILLEQKNNILLQKVIFLALDPFTQFFIRKIPKYLKHGKGKLEDSIKELEKLSTREFTGNAGIEFLKNLLENLSVDDAKVIERIIQKDLKCGVGAAIVNKIWPGLIFEYPCMLASGYTDKLISKMRWPAFAQLKMDGMRFNAVVEGGVVKFRSRNGKVLELLGNLEPEFSEMAAGENLVFDGELLYLEDGNFANRQTGNGIISKSVKGTISAKEAAGVHAVVWDVVNLEDFKLGISKVPYQLRFSNLKNLICCERVSLVRSDLVKDIGEAQEIYKKYIVEKEEGIILKDPMGVWEDKRSTGQIKFKAELECDLLIVGFELGSGKMSKMLGNLNCQSADGVIKVDVGSGFSEQQRIDFLKEKIIGKVVAVKYNGRMVNKKGEETLFLPIFVEIREDKGVADSSDQIK